MIIKSIQLRNILPIKAGILNNLADKKQSLFEQERIINLL